MNNILHNSPTNGAIYNSIGQIQTIYSQYIQVRNQLKTLDDRLRISNEQFDKFPTQHNLYTVQDIWNQKVLIMQQIANLANSIISGITEATKIILTSMLSSIDANNRLNILLNDNAIGSIYSLTELNPYQFNLKEMYRQSCFMQNIPSLLSNIEIKTQMMRLSLPNFDNLKKLIRGY